MANTGPQPSVWDGPAGDWASRTKVSVELSALCEVLATFRRYSGPVEAHQSAIKELHSWVQGCSSPVLEIWLHPAHAEAIVAICQIAESMLISSVTGATRREKRKNASKKDKALLRSWGRLRRQAEVVTFLMATGRYFSVGAGDDPFHSGTAEEDAGPADSSDDFADLQAVVPPRRRRATGAGDTAGAQLPLDWKPTVGQAAIAAAGASR